MRSELPAREGSDDKDPRSPGILLVDDYGFVLTLLRLELESCSVSVWPAMNGLDAIDLYLRHREEIDLVLLDVEMPGLDGPKTLVALRRINPALVACFMTGGSGRYSEQALLACGASCVFYKPFPADRVARFLELLVRTPLCTPALCGCDSQTAPEEGPS